MDDAETVALTRAMLRSGDAIDLRDVPGLKVDKHSTGGVGDKVSICLAPLVAACGVRVPMVSGRGLGHTGGTIDKLEAIPGFRTDLDPDAIRDQAASVGCVIAAQTADVVPADGAVYALRDATATVRSIPLIAVQKGGRAGGVTASNFSSKAVITSHGGGAGTAAAESSVWPQLSSSGEVDSCARWAIARREPISPTTAMPAATKKSEQRTFRNRSRVNAFFEFVITELLSRRFYPEVIKVVNIFQHGNMEYRHPLQLADRQRLSCDAAAWHTR
jgi:hypothetical protein